MSLYDVRSLVEMAGSCRYRLPSGETIPARPIADYRLTVRLKAAWLVLTGRADAVVWPTPSPEGDPNEQ